MYATLYAADNLQIVLDTIKDTENTKPLFINHYILEETQLGVITEVQDGIPESVAKDLPSIIEYIHKFYPESGQTDMEIPGCGAPVANMDYANLAHRLIDHMYKSVKAYIDDPSPMSEKMGEEIEKELENLK